MNQFVDLKQSEYNQVYLYDDNEDNIDNVDNLQHIFEEVLSNSNADIKQDIIERFKSNKLHYSSCLITENKLNPFIEKKAELLLPNKVKRFDNFL